MRVIAEQQLEQALAALPAAEPRVVASGNLATPRALLDMLERTMERYRLFMLAAQAPLPVRDGVILETPFVGPGMRGAGERLDYLPMRLSLVPRLFATMRPPDVVLLHTSTPRGGEGLARNRGEHPPSRHRAGPCARRSGDSAVQPTDALHARRQRARSGPHRPRDRSAGRPSLARDRTRTRTRRADRRARRRLDRGRVHAAARHRPGPRRDAARARRPPQPCDLVGDDQRRRDGPRPRRSARSAHARSRAPSCSARPSSMRGSIRTPG